MLLEFCVVFENFVFENFYFLMMVGGFVVGFVFVWCMMSMKLEESVEGEFELSDLME